MEMYSYCSCFTMFEGLALLVELLPIAYRSMLTDFFVSFESNIKS